MSGSGLAVDVIVVGSGGAGLTAALTAASRGAKVILYEGGQSVGGTYGYSTGILWVPGNRYAAEMGIEDSVGEARKLIEGLSGGKHDPQLLRAFLANANEALEYVEGQGARFELLPGIPDHLPDRPGAMTQGRALGSPVFDPQLDLPQSWASALRPSPYYADLPVSPAEMQSWGGYSNIASWDSELLLTRRARGLVGFGAATIGQLLASALRVGVDISLNTRVARLLTSRDRERVEGVLIENEGALYPVEARQGVVLAVGGYDHNRGLQARLDRHAPVSALSHPGVDGEVFAEALSLGAGFVNSGGQLLSPVIQIPEKGERFFFAREVAFPGSLVVNRSGQRFVDDSFTTSLARAMATYDPDQGSYPNLRGYFIFDEEWSRRYRLPGRSEEGVANKIVTANTPESLAAQLGMRRSALAETLRRYNTLCERGVDLDFARGSSGYARAAGDPAVEPNPCLRPLSPPFFALPIQPGSMGTLSGLLVDSKGRVLRADQSIIRGLYATGNTMGGLVEGYFYTAGLANARALVFGYLAALSATEQQAHFE